MTSEEGQNSLLITGETVLTLGANREIINNGAVAIQGDNIVAVGKSDDLRRRFSGNGNPGRHW
jgi:5-methylthioadenosine/S-adenosylhomocysteine deaminase